MPESKRISEYRENHTKWRRNSTALLAKDYEDWKPFKSGMKLSNAKTARYRTGEEVVGILAQHGLIGICGPDC